jgi:hypothetical protein
MLEVCLLSQRSDLATPIRSVTERLSLSPASSTRCPISVPCGNACPEGRDNGLTLFRLNDTNDVVPAYTPAACICPCAPSPRWRQPAARLLAEACQRLWLLGNDGACGSSHLLDISFSLTLSPPWRWQCGRTPHGVLPIRRKKYVVSAAFDPAVSRAPRGQGGSYRYLL